MSFTKLFSTITASTIWCEDHATRIVWVTMLAMADRDGYVAASVPGLAAMARVSVGEAEVALGKFRAPDKYSRSQENEGRRVIDADGGWLLLNYSKYREERDKEVRRENNREAVRKHRAKEKLKQNPESSNITDDDSNQCKPRSSQAEAEAEERENAAGAATLPLLPHEPEPEAKPIKPRDEAKLLWAATLKSQSAALKIPAPSIGGKVRDEVVRMAREHAAHTGESFASVLLAWVAGGLRVHVATGKAPQWAIKDFRPYGPSGRPGGAGAPRSSGNMGGLP